MPGARTLSVRVLHLAAGNMYGGIERILATLAAGRHFAPAMDAEFAFCWDGRSRSEIEAAGARTHLLAPARLSRPLSILRARRALAALLERERYDVVVTHGAWLHAMFAGTVRARRLPLAFWLHSVTAGRHWTEKWARLTPPDLLLCGSADVARTARTLFPTVAPTVFYTPMPIVGAPEPGAREAVRAELGAAPGEVVIVQVSRMDPLKGQALHLAALARMQDLPGWTCWFVGGVQLASDQAYFDEMRATAARLELGDRVRFVGQRSDVPRVLAGADVFCQPNQWSEGLSIAWLEAAQAALPIVTMNLGTAPEFVGDVAGILVPPGDVDALAAALRRLVADPALRARLGAGGRDRVREWCDPARQVARLHDLLSAAARGAAGDADRLPVSAVAAGQAR